MATSTSKTKRYFRPDRNANKGTNKKGSDHTETESDNDCKLRKFFEAIKDGNVGEVRRLLHEHKIDVNKALPDETRKASSSEEDLRVSGRGNNYVDLHSKLPGNSPFHLSASSGHDDICKVLIEDGKADVNIRNHIGDTPLHCAARGSHAQTCQLLLKDSEISVNLKNDTDDRPLHLAVANGDVEVCRILIQDRRVNVDARNKIRSTPLHKAVDENHVDVCQMLIKEGKANVNLENDWGTPLHKAAGHDHTEISRSVNIGCDCTEICRILIRDGNADVNIRNKVGDTPLYKAAYKKNLEACRILIEERHTKVNLWNKVQDSPLHAAAEQNSAEICRLLIKDGKAHVNMVNKVGNTPLHCAFKSGRTHAEVAKVLLEIGDADPDLKNKEGKTALDYKIVGRHNSEIIKTAIKNVTNHKKLIVEEDGADRIKLFMCGNPGAGKTTLVNSLTKGFWSSLTSSKESSSTESYCPTPGIQVKSKHIKGAGDFSIWDMAGQVESHLTHAMFLSKSKGIFVCVYDTTDQNTMEQLHYWLRFLKAGRDTADTKPEVVIVGTHLDRQGNTDYALRDAKSLLDKLVDQYSEFLNIHKESIVMDARQSHGSHLDIVKATLKILAQPLRDAHTPKPRICRKIIKSMKEWCSEDFPLLTWTEFAENVKASVDCLADEDLINKAADCLHEAGKVFLAKLVDHEDVLILDINWLTSKIFAPIFGKYDLGLPNPGLRNAIKFTKKQLVDQIQMDDPEVAIALLKHFELAYSYLRDDDEIFVIPAKLPPDVSYIDWTPDSQTYVRYTGVCIECKDHTDMFAVDVFPCVQVSLMKRYHQQGKEPNLSCLGVKVMDEVEGMVQLNEQRTAMHIAVREIVGLDQDAAKQLTEMKQIVLDEIERRSGGTETEESYLSPKEMSSSQHLLVHRFSGHEVEQADAENKSLCGPTLNQETVCSIKGCLGDGDYENIDWQPQENSSSCHRSSSRYQKYSHQHSQTRHLNMGLPVQTQQDCHSCLQRAQRHRNLSLPTHVLQDQLQCTQTRQHSRSLPPSPIQCHGRVFQTRRAITHVKSANSILTYKEEQQETAYLHRQQSAPSFNTPLQGFYCHPLMQGSLQHLLNSSMNPLLKSQDHLVYNSCRPSCGWECIPLDIQSKVYQLLDREHPLGRDYRVIAEVFGHSQEEVRGIARYPFRDMSVSAAIIKVAYMRRRLDPGDYLSIHEMWTLIKHPGIVGNEEAAKLIEDFLADNGYKEPWTPCELEFGVEDEVLLHRAILRQTRDDIRQFVKASDIINALEGPLSEDDIQEIRRCEGDQAWNCRMAVDLLLNKLLRLRDVEWYPTFCEAVRKMGWTLVLEVLWQAEKDLRRHQAFSKLTLKDPDMGVSNASAQHTVCKPYYNPGYSEA